MPRAYKRPLALTNSTWYKCARISQTAWTADNNGAFDLSIGKMRRGTEPPPHVHSREDEYFYVLSGEMRVHVGGEIFAVTAWECMFLPRRKPHAFLITSEAVHMISLIVPGSLLDAVNQMNASAGRMGVPTDVDTVTYADAELTDAAKSVQQHGVRFLTADEIHTEMPQYAR
jgi:mannose-6-phosphate isomerase-like protein (cupin superfamily)